VREESHLDEMRSAIRGDFERLAHRRGRQELMQVAPKPTEPESDSEPDPASEAETESPGTGSRSWLDRLRSR
jgi:hypothetical protein